MEIIQPNGTLFHLYGEADAGRTETIFSILNEATEYEQLCGYWIPGREQFRQDVFNRSVAYLDRCVVGFPKKAKDLPVFLQTTKSLDLVCIDNFLEYILHKPKKHIRAVFSLLSAAAYKNRTNFILVNDMRFWESKGMHPAYQEYFRYFCSKHILVEKDSDFHIHYGFNKI